MPARSWLLLSACLLAACSVQRTVPELNALLRPHDVIYRPDAIARAPTVLLFHTCRGRLPDHEQSWARRLTSEGWAVISVDGIAARGGNTGEVCRGNRLWGNERAGDVQVSVAYARTLPFVDPDRIAVIGYSHGGWAVLDALTLNSPRDPPRSLDRLPDGGLTGLRAAIVLYPYCGFPAAHRLGWDAAVPVLALLAGDDRLADPAACRAAFAEAVNKGAPVRVVAFPGATHGFDQPLGHNDFVHYDPALTGEVLERAVAFLAGRFDRAPVGRTWRPGQDSNLRPSP